MHILSLPTHSSKTEPETLKKRNVILDTYKHLCNIHCYPPILLTPKTKPDTVEKRQHI